MLNAEANEDGQTRQNKIRLQAYSSILGILNNTVKNPIRKR